MSRLNWSNSFALILKSSGFGSCLSRQPENGYKNKFCLKALGTIGCFQKATVVIATDDACMHT